MSGPSRILRLEERLEEMERRLNVLHPAVPRRKYLCDRSNPLVYLDDVKFHQAFHMNKETARFVFAKVEADLQHRFQRGFHIPPMMQLLIALRFYTTGSFQICVGDIYNTSQSTVSRIVERVSKALAKQARTFIKYPSFNEAASVSRSFAEIGGFPGVIGCIDCTHIHITSPGGNTAELFRNRKTRFSINVQAIGNSNLEFINLVARWYGSAHDSRIFDTSVIKDKLENGLVPGLLLGDSGYACTPYLMTPLKNPSTAPERRYNVAQIKTRNAIERLFGVWKRRYPCLNNLRTKLSTSLAVIMAVGALHNICRMRGDFLANEDNVTTNNNYVNTTPAQPTQSGRAARASLIARKF